MRNIINICYSIDFLPLKYIIKGGINKYSVTKGGMYDSYKSRSCSAGI